MAKNIQEAEVIVTLNGTAAKNAVAELSNEYNKLKQAALDAHKAGDEALGKKLDAQAQKLMKDIEITRRETKKFADILKNIDGASLKELRSVAKQLQSEINKLTPGTQQFIEKSKQLQQVNTRIRQLTNGFKGVVEEEKRAIFSMKSLSESFNKYFAMISAGIAAITGLSLAFRKAAQDAAALDDTYADVMKTTNLLHEDVGELDKELMKIDTRTSREQLLLLARDAGKLGIQGKENILGFVRATDQIQVALGEDLGEGAIKNLGKIADVLGYTQSMGIEKSLLSIASSINAVGQASTASEAYLVDFAQRMAGVAAQTGISAANIIGFASGLDQSAMKVEMASTAFQKFLMKLYEDPAKFAAYANLEVEKFTDLLKNDANQAVITILKALKDQDGFASLVPIFQDMGLDGARAVSVLAAMATNINAVTDAQALANDEFEKATSVTEEYNTKNNNMQAQLEKARKEFHNASITLGQSLNPVLLKSTKLTTHLVKVLATYGKEIRNATIAIVAITLAIKRQAAAQTALNVVQKVGNTLRATGNTILWAARTAFLRLIGATEAATIAQQQLNAVMSASVFGVIALAIGGLTMAITHWVKKSREAMEVTDQLAEADKRATEEYGEQAGKIKALTSIVENNNIALAERKKALEELKRIVPGYHGDLTEEGRLINSNKVAIDEYCKSLREKIRLEARKDQLAEIEKQIAALEDQKANAEERQHQALVESGGDTTEKGWGKHSWFTGKLEFTPYGQAVQDAKDLQDQIDILEKQAEKISDRIGKVFTDPIEKIKAEYEAMFDQIRKESVDAPNEGEIEIKRLKEERDLKIEEIRKTYAVKNTVEQSLQTEANTILTQTQYNYLQERQDKLTKKEREMVVKGYASLSEEESKSLKARYDKLMKADLKLSNQRYQQEVKSIEMQQREELNTLNRQLFDREITSDQHEERLVEIKVKYLEEKKTLAEKYGQDTSTIEQQLLTAEVERYKFYYNQELKLSEKRRMEEEISLREQLSTRAITQEEFDRRMIESREKYLKEQQELALGYNQDGSGIQLKDIQARQKEEESALKQHLINQEITQEEYDRRMIDTRVKYIQQRLQLAQQSGQDETSILQEYLDAQLEAEELAEKQMAKLKVDAKKVISGLNPSDARKTELEEQLKQLDVLHNAKLLSEEQFREAVRKANKQFDDEELQARLSNVQKYTEQVNSIMQEASNFVNALKEAESAQLEAQYQADLTAAGDNAEKREQIEADYEQKKLDLQKKYADVDMAINIAKTVANGAAAVVKALADPGGIAGTILAVTIGATTAAEVATIIAQRNAIKNTSVNSSGTGGSSSVKTGTRTITGYSEGGNTKRAASDSTVVGVVHANEWVAPAWMVRRNPTVFADLEQYRRTLGRGRMKLAKPGFADGGFANKGETATNKPTITDIDIERAVHKGIRAALEGEWLRAYLVRRDLTEMDAQDARFKNQTSRS